MNLQIRSKLTGHIYNTNVEIMTDADSIIFGLRNERHQVLSDDGKRFQIIEGRAYLSGSKLTWNKDHWNISDEFTNFDPPVHIGLVV